MKINDSIQNTKVLFRWFSGIKLLNDLALSVLLEEADLA